MRKNRELYLTGLLLLGVILLAPLLLLGTTPDTRRLESRLATAAGQERMEILVELTKAYADKDPKKVQEYGREALELAEKFPSARDQVVLLNLLSSAGTLQGDFKQAQEYAERSRTLAQQTGDSPGLADALNNLGQAYLYQGEYKQALDLCTAAQNLYEEIGQSKGLARSHYLQAGIYWRTGDLSKAMDQVLQADKIYKKFEDPRGMALLDMLTGNIYSTLGQYKKALEYHLKAQPVFESLGDKVRLSQIYSNIGHNYTRLKNDVVALNYYEKCLKISLEINARQSISFVYNNIGEVYANQENYPRALDYFNRSLEIKEKFDDQMGIAYTLVNIGSVYRKQGRYKEALPPLNRGLTIASAINTRPEIQRASKELSEVYTALHRYPLAMQHLKKYKEIKDFIFNEVSSQKLTEMQTRYEMEKKQRDIDLLKKDNAIYQLTVHRQRIFNHFIIITAGLLLIAGFLVYTRYRLKVKIARAMTREIEEHRQTTQKLKESEEKFKLLAESSVVGIYIIQDNAVKYVNPKFLSIWGCTGDEVLEQGPLTLIYEEDRPLVLEKMNRRLTGSDSTVRYEFRGVSRRNGEILYLESYGGMIHYQGKPAVLETVIDITARKKTAEKLLKSHKLEAMGILVGGIAHDFNNLLGVLVGYLEMVKEEIQPGTHAQQLVENIENNYNRAVDLGQKLTAFAKTPWIVPQKLTLPSILTGAIRDNPAMASLIDTVSIPGDLLFINGDERQLKQVFIHLFHYLQRVKRGEETPGVLIPDPGVSITAGSLYLPGENDYLLDAGEYVRIRVTDSGWSVPSKQVEKIFEPSFSAAPSINSQKGVGLELALCHSIIKKHNGNISAASGPGKGITFEIILPAYQE